MDEAASNMLNEEIKRVLGVMKELDTTSDEYSVAADNLVTLMNIVNNDRKACAELTTAVSVSEKEEKKHEIDKEQIKIEKRKIIVDGAKAFAGAVVATAVPMYIAAAEHNGWWFSRTALSSVAKTKL